MSKIITLTCKSCGGTMEFDGKNNIIACPFCGSKEILIESDKVKVEQIKADVEKAKIHSEEKRSNMEFINEIKDNIIGVIALIFFLILLYIGSTMV